MKCEQKFYRCKHCGNLVGSIQNSGALMACCDEPMEVLCPNTVEAATEKHLPEVSVNGRLVYAKVGSTPHPMTEEHHIDFIYLRTENGGQMKRLKVEWEAQAMFVVLEDTPLDMFAYCNLHGLWKIEIPCESGGVDDIVENYPTDAVCSAEFSEGCI